MKPIWKIQSIFFAILGFGFFLMFIYYFEIFKPIFIYQAYYKVIKPKNVLYCHFLKSLDALPDIQGTAVIKDQSIFFLETSCSSYWNGKISIKPRQACAVESAALMNPNRTVYLLYASPGRFQDDRTVSDRLIKNLQSYPNVKILHFDLETFVKGTPVENLWRSERIQKSKYIIPHTSDILRLLILWKYGGIYLDLDVVVIKTLETLPMNFVGAEDSQIIGSSVLSFGKDGFGHIHANTCLDDISKNFDGSQWAYNGPLVITRLLHKICNTTDVSKMINTTCQGLKVLPASAFFPVHWSSWEIFFNETKIENVREKSKDSYLIHMWNKLSSETKIPLYKDTPYFDFSRRFCPGSVINFEEYFRRK